MTRALRPTLLAMLVVFTMVTPAGSAADIDRTAVDFTDPGRHQVGPERRRHQRAGGALRRSEQAGAVRRADQVVPREHEPPPLPSQRPLLRGRLRHLVDGHGREVRSREHGAGAGGSYVIHYAGKVHYDGAKTEETVIQVWGMGPATATPAEKR